MTDRNARLESTVYFNNIKTESSKTELVIFYNNYIVIKYLQIIKRTLVVFTDRGRILKTILKTKL